MDNDRHPRRGRDGRRHVSRSASRGGYKRRDSSQRTGEGCYHSSPERQDRQNNRRGRRRCDSASESSSVTSLLSSSSRSAQRRRHSKKRHRKDKKKKCRKKKDHRRPKLKKSHRRKSRSRSSSNSSRSSVTPAPADPPGAHELASALTQLFHSYPAMSFPDEGGIPLLFIQLGRGTEYNLSQMPDRNLAQSLGAVFKALEIHGMDIGSDGAWRWSNAVAPAAGGTQRGRADLVLLRLARALLNEVGLTLNIVETYEQDQRMQLRQKEMPLDKDHNTNHEVQVKETAVNSDEKADKNEKDVRHRKRVERMTSQMLDRFDPKNSSSAASSLADELQGICTILMEGESVQLDGVENGKLKATLAQLFQLIGLELVEMEDDADSKVDHVENDDSDGKIMGYALPDLSDKRDDIESNLKEVLRVCQYQISGGSEGAPTSWAAKPAIKKGGQGQEESSSDDGNGPTPLGTVAAVKASKRKRPLQISKLSEAMTGRRSQESGREEWMMVPGEHDSLKGIQEGGPKSLRGRTFKNERNHGQPTPPSFRGHSGPINPEVLEEVNAIRLTYEQTRGPSLLDIHRHKQQAVKQQQLHQCQKKYWKWSRDKNLDDGRRVDKNALNIVLGGATTELKSKFQGSLGH